MSDLELLPPHRDGEQSYSENSSTNQANNTDKNSMKTQTLCSVQPQQQQESPKRSCDLKYWAPRIGIVLLLLIVALLVFIFRE